MNPRSQHPRLILISGVTQSREGGEVFLEPHASRHFPIQDSHPLASACQLIQQYHCFPSVYDPFIQVRNRDHTVWGFNGRTTAHNTPIRIVTPVAVPSMLRLLSHRSMLLLSQETKVPFRTVSDQ